MVFDKTFFPCQSIFYLTKSPIISQLPDTVPVVTFMPPKPVSYVQCSANSLTNSILANATNSISSGLSVSAISLCVDSLCSN